MWAFIRCSPKVWPVLLSPERLPGGCSAEVPSVPQAGASWGARGGPVPWAGQAGMHGTWRQQDIPETEGWGQGVPELGQGSLRESVRGKPCTEDFVRTLTLRTGSSKAFTRELQAESHFFFFCKITLLLDLE